MSDTAPVSVELVQVDRVNRGHWWRWPSLKSASRAWRSGSKRCRSGARPGGWSYLSHAPETRAAHGWPPAYCRRRCSARWRRWCGRSCGRARRLTSAGKKLQHFVRVLLEPYSGIVPHRVDNDPHTFASNKLERRDKVRIRSDNNN